MLREPSVVAVHTKTGAIVQVGQEAYEMIGKTPAEICAVRPLENGVISDYKMTEEMIKYFLRKATRSGSLIKPRVVLCVPSLITSVEAKAVVSAAVTAGARTVYLIEEPVAAAIGAGIDISRPCGSIVADIGGGTCDIAVLSFSGIVRKTSIKVAGDRFNEAIVRYVRVKYGILIGERMAERVKISIASADRDAPELQFDVKGRSLVSGLPIKQTITRAELYPIILELATEISEAVRTVMEKTPPELVGDLYNEGLVMTGGGALLDGLDLFLHRELKMPVRIAENPIECVAIGTGRAFEYIGKLTDGFVSSSTHQH